MAAGAKIGNEKLRIFRLKKNGELVNALRSIQGNADALWLAPDALFVNPENFKLISDFCLANKIALFAPSPLLARAGALAGLAPDARAMGRAAGTAAASYAAGKNPGLRVQPGKSELAVNREVARALGLKIPSSLHGLP